VAKKAIERRKKEQDPCVVFLFVIVLI